MNNWYAIESEADFRRHQWEREAVQARAALAGAESNLPDWLKLPRFSLPILNLPRFSATSRLSFSGPASMRQTSECSC